MIASEALRVLFASLSVGVALHAQRPRMERVRVPGEQGSSALGSVPGARLTNIDVSRAPGPQNEVAIAIAPDDPSSLVVAAHDYRSNSKHIGTWASWDGGRTWKGGQVAGIGRYGFEGDPSLAAHRKGVFYLGYIDHGTLGNRVAVARSMDGGATWPRIGVVANSSNPFSEDKPYLTVDDTRGRSDGNVYVTWVRFTTTGRQRILCARSTDQGLTFEPPVGLTSPAFGDITGPVPVVGPRGELYVAWKGASSIEFSRSLDGGLTFSPPTTVASSFPLPSPLPGARFRVSPFPTLAVDRSGGPEHGTLLVAWADRRGVGSGPDVVLARSVDRGETWSALIRVSDDTNSAYQFFPWMCVGPDGVISVVFHDQREAPNSPRYHTVLARSLDGGRSFGANLRLSDEITDVSLDAAFRGTFVGDYIGIAASRLGVYPVWTDLRPSLGQMEIFVRPLRPVGR